MTKIVKFLKPYMGATVAALFFSLFNNLMQLILPAMMALMINTGIGDGAWALFSSSAALWRCSPLSR